MRLGLRINALFLCLLAAPALASTHALAWQGKAADGHEIRFDPQHLHHPALLLFWATWCPYCEALMPYLQDVYNAAGRDRLDVYAIDIKDDGHPAATLRERHLTFTLVRDGDAIADAYGVEGTPGLFLVDTNGDIIYRRDGGGEPAKVEAALRARLHLGKAHSR
ncbi:MAG: TlpA family protein disulfide reductase [Rudaea sp.]